MAEGVSNTSPLQYLHRIGCLHLLSAMFDSVLVPEAVRAELEAGKEKGHDVPTGVLLSSFRIEETGPHQSIDRWKLGPGETAVLSACLEDRQRIAILDDRLARKAAESFGCGLLERSAFSWTPEQRAGSPHCGQRWNNWPRMDFVSILVFERNFCAAPGIRHDA